MPEINGAELPVVSVSVEDLEALKDQLENMTMPLEAMIEVVVYLKREVAKVEAVEAVQKAMADRIKNIMDGLPPEQRDTRRVNVGMVTYSDERQQPVLKDRDWTVEHLTSEQLRISYKPDLKNLETILPEDEFNRHVTTKRVPSRISVREEKGITDYEELDF